MFYLTPEEHTKALRICDAILEHCEKLKKHTDEVERILRELQAHNK